MNHRRPNGKALETRLLAACRQALVEGRWQVAEHLLRALEELPRADPQADVTLEQAYLLLAERGTEEQLRQWH